jgi:hypothetical protein
MSGTNESTTLAEAAESNYVTSAYSLVSQFKGGYFFLFEQVEEICSLQCSTLVRT